PVVGPSLVPSISKTIPPSLQQSDPSVGLSQQQSPGIGTDRSPVEARHHPARKKLFRLETVLITLCHSEGRPFLGANLFSINMFMPEVTAFCYIFGEKCGLERIRIREALSERFSATARPRHSETNRV